MLNKIAVAVLMLCAAACAARHPRPAAPPASAEAALQSLPAPGEYPIDSNDSELRLLVYRAGPLRNLGHNHVMVNRTLTGHVQIGADVSASSFSLHLRADAFLIDDAQSRQEEGGEFTGDVPEDAKAGTRRNMLSGAVLDAAEYPEITVKSASLSGRLNAVERGLGNQCGGTYLTHVGSAHLAGRCTSLHCGRFGGTAAVGLGPGSIQPDAWRLAGAGRDAAKIQDYGADELVRRIGVPSGARSTAAGTDRNPGGISPFGSMPLSARCARVPPTSSTSNRNVARLKSAG